MKKYEKPLISVESLSEADIIRTSEEVTTSKIGVEWGSDEYNLYYGDK